MKTIRILIVLVVQLIAWGIMTLTDLYEETTNNQYEMVTIILVPCLIVLFYLIYRKRLYAYQEVKWKDIGLLQLTWFAFSVAFGIIISVLVGQNLWIVHQATGGWENFLNGIEYAIFAVFLCLLPMFLVLIIEVIFTIKNRKNYM